VHLDDVTRLTVQLDHATRAWRADLKLSFIRRDLTQRLVASDHVTDGDMPLGNLCLDHTLTDLGQLEHERHWEAPVALIRALSRNGERMTGRQPPGRATSVLHGGARGIHQSASLSQRRSHRCL
jgi:hypothetical protein